jgi:hypothetical protein
LPSWAAHQHHYKEDLQMRNSVEHGLMRRRDVNDAIRIAMRDDIDADMAGRN